MGVGGSCEYTFLRAEHGPRGGGSQQSLYRAISTAEIQQILTLEQQPAGSTLLAHKLPLLWGSPFSAPEISWEWQQSPFDSPCSSCCRALVSGMLLGGRPGSISKLHCPWLWSSLWNYSAWRCTRPVLAVANSVKLCGMCTRFADCGSSPKCFSPSSRAVPAHSSSR